jgi:very-short-patch-repair endonuclease
VMTVIRTSDSSSRGFNPRTLQRHAAAEKIERVSRGIYLLDGASSSADDRWLSRLDAHLLRGGPGSAISHRAAARLHGLEGFTEGEHFEDVTITSSAGWKSPPAIRSRTLTPADVVLLGGRPVTSVARTLADVGRFVTPDVHEFALHHALRGTDRRRPDVWNTDLLDELMIRADQRNSYGTSVLRASLDRYGTGRPSGSFAETILHQHARTAGIHLVRQPTVVVVTKRGRTVATYFPDNGEFELGLLVEVDGRLGHEGDEKVDRDDRRQNELVLGFHVHRIHARRLFAEPKRVVDELVRVRSLLAVRSSPWHGPGGIVVEWSGDSALLIR